MCNEVVWVGLIMHRIAKAGFCEYANKLVGALNGGDFIE
jgi:hypothetical protein